MIIELTRANTDINKIKTYKAIILNSDFLSIYGLPFCILYNNKIKKGNSLIHVALEINNQQGTATLAIINNFPNIIINSNLQRELLIIKENCKSTTKLFSSVQNFKDLLTNIALQT